MPWRVGLDEAGYGPNLGPLVLASSSCHVPATADGCLWQILSAAVRKAEHSDDGRLLIDDSKKVNEGKAGLARLEAGVFAVMALRRKRLATALDYLQEVALGDSLEDLHGEPWFDSEFALPAALVADAMNGTAMAEACVNVGIQWGPIHSVVIPAPKFNRLLEDWKVKSGVLATGVIALLRATLELPGNEPIHIAVDKLGGRHFYAPLLHEAFPDGWVRVIREGPSQCEYAIDNLDREVHIRFEPRADGNHLNVALASMAAKYLREVCMLQFNRYWTDMVANLKPTAGYPGDAGRFFDEIRPALVKNGIAEHSVWRAK
ncbi:MAG TPA: hypothetical protein VHR66_09655 [Gemmataceae bacterium]|jgi:ribonuclease HII|nr:hypothetical protein [Gemmataceae bacterium]